MMEAGVNSIALPYLKRSPKCHVTASEAERYYTCHFVHGAW